MAFTLEDGTGVTDSNGYIDETFADTYHTDRGQTAWMFTDTAGTIAVTVAAKRSAIIRATDHVDKVFGNRFRGMKETSTQGLKWPRSGAYDQNRYALSGVPKPLEKAVAEYALRALLYGNLTPDAPPTSPRQSLESGEDLAGYGEGGGGEVISYLDKTGPLTEETKYAPGTSGKLPIHAGADLMMQELLMSRSNRLVRG